MLLCLKFLVLKNLKNQKNELGKVSDFIFTRLHLDVNLGTHYEPYWPQFLIKQCSSCNPLYLFTHLIGFPWKVGLNENAITNTLLYSNKWITMLNSNQPLDEFL